MKNKMIFTAGILSSLLVSGCFLKNKDSHKTELTFSWWGKEARHEYTVKGIEKFQELYPDITVSYDYGEWAGYEDKFDELYKSGGTADVMQINFDWLYKYSSDGNGFYDLSSLADILELPDFTLSELEYGKMNGKLNALPTAFNAYIPVYDETMFLKYGLPVPETWDDLFKAAKYMGKDGCYVIGVSRKTIFFLVIAWFEQTHQKPVFQDNQTWNLTEAETEEIILFLKKLLDERVVFPGIYDFKESDIADSRIASAVCWCSENSRYADVIEKRGGKAVLGNFISTPGAENSGWYLKPATMYAIKKDCAHPKEAAVFMNYLLNSREMTLLQKCEKGIPVSNRSLTTLIEEKQLAEMEYLGLMKIRFNKTNINKMIPIMENKDIVNFYYSDSMSFIEGKATLRESALNFCSNVNKIIMSLK